MNSGENTDATFAPPLACLCQSKSRNRFPLRAADLRERVARRYQTRPFARQDRFPRLRTTRAGRVFLFASARSSPKLSWLAHPRLKENLILYFSLVHSVDHGLYVGRNGAAFGVEQWRGSGRRSDLTPI